MEINKCNYCKNRNAPPSQSSCWGCTNNSLYEPFHEYKEIKELHKYCKKIGINAIIEPLYDGYAIRFPSGADIVQHTYSYASTSGCVEPAICSKWDYTAVPLKKAKALVKRHKKSLNKGRCSNAD